MFQTRSGQMSCQRNPNKTYTWYYHDELPRSRKIDEEWCDLKEPRVTFSGRDDKGIPIIEGHCPICGLLHRISDEDAIKITEEFEL